MRWRTVYVAFKKNEIFDWLYAIAGTVPDPVAPDVLHRYGVASEFSYGMSSIYFLSKSDVVGDGFPEKFPTDYRYDFLHDDMSRLYIFKDKIVGLNDLVFQNENELFDYMKQFDGYKIPQNKPARIPMARPPEGGIEYKKAVPIGTDTTTRGMIEEEDSKKKP